MENHQLHRLHPHEIYAHRPRRKLTGIGWGNRARAPMVLVAWKMSWAPSSMAAGYGSMMIFQIIPARLFDNQHCRMYDDFSLARFILARFFDNQHKKHGN